MGLVYVVLSLKEKCKDFKGEVYPEFLIREQILLMRCQVGRVYFYKDEENLCSAVRFRLKLHLCLFLSMWKPEFISFWKFPFVSLSVEGNQCR